MRSVTVRSCQYLQGQAHRAREEVRFPQQRVRRAHAEPVERPGLTGSCRSLKHDHGTCDASGTQ
jgi:hypothetical protein